MNLLPLAALIVASLAFGTAVTALAIANKLRTRKVSPERRELHNVQALFDGLPKPRHQVLSRGTLIIPAEVSPDGREMTIELDPDPEVSARKIAARIARSGRHL